MLRGSSFAGRVMRQRSAAAPVWEKTVGPLSLPSYKRTWVNLQRDIDNKLNAAENVSTKVTPVDWASFESSIKDTATVASMKAEYEAKLAALDAQAAGEKTPEQAAAEAATALRRKNMNAIMEKWSGIADEQIAALKLELAEAKSDRATMETWSLDDFYKKTPGLDKQMFEEFENDQYWATEEQEKLGEIDFAEHSKKLAEGVVVAPAREDLPERVGDFNTEEQLDGKSCLAEQLMADLRNAVAEEERPAMDSRFRAIEKELAAQHPTMGAQ